MRLTALDFAERIESGVAQLLQISSQEKVAAFDAGSKYLDSPKARPVREAISDALIKMGYGEYSARLDPQMLIDFLSRQSLELVVDNKAALPGGRDLLDGETVPIGYDMTVAAFPVGPVVVIGSGNSLVPGLVAAVEALLANCPVALRGSRVNKQALELAITALRSAGNSTLTALLEHLNLFFLDHRVPVEAEQLYRLLRTGPFAAGCFWGGREALDRLIAEFGQNPRHPVVIAMEPLTGVAVISQRHLDAPSSGPVQSLARGLAEAVLVMGQQLCSSPTEAYFVGRVEQAESFGSQVARELGRIAPRHARAVSDAYAIRLDRLRDRAAAEGATVIGPAYDAPDWTLLISDQKSVFSALSADLALGVHDRTGFLEIIAVPDVVAAAAAIHALPGQPGHSEVRQVQTVLRLIDKDEARELVGHLRATGRGVYRVVPPEYVARRHPHEPLDGQHLVSLLTRKVAIL
jgi:hypothetical protein